jgi:hypothetical protein
MNAGIEIQLKDGSKFKVSDVKPTLEVPYYWKDKDLTIIDAFFTEDAIPVYIVKDARIKCAIINNAIVIGVFYKSEYFIKVL